jgi:HpcH/HpaI aldolase/citrate lyase family protein
MRPTRSRLHRSELAVPGSNIRMLEKAPKLGADIVMLDLEDAVAPDDKPQARTNVIDALNELDWDGCSVSLRINGLDTHYCYRDIVDVVEQAGRHLDSIMIPKASGAGDIHLVATLLTQIEEAMGLERKIALSVLIETASAAPTGCARSMGRSGTSPTPRGTSPRRAARQCWAMRASGRSTPARSGWLDQIEARGEQRPQLRRAG